MDSKKGLVFFGWICASTFFYECGIVFSLWQCPSGARPSRLSRFCLGSLRFSLGPTPDTLNTKTNTAYILYVFWAGLDHLIAIQRLDLVVVLKVWQAAGVPEVICWVYKTRHLLQMCFKKHVRFYTYILNRRSHLCVNRKPRLVGPAIDGPTRLTPDNCVSRTWSYMTRLIWHDAIRFVMLWHDMTCVDVIWCGMV